MEEILASIRRIIADDQSRARMTTKLVPVPAQEGEKPAEPEPEERAVDARVAVDAVQEAAPSAAEAEAEIEMAAPEAAAMISEEAHHDEVIEPGTTETGAEPAETATARAEAGQAPAQSGYAVAEPRGSVSMPASELAPVAKLEAEVAKLVQDTFAREGFGHDGFVQEEQSHDLVLHEVEPHDAEESAADMPPPTASPASSYVAAAPQPTMARPSAAANEDPARRQAPQAGPMTAAAQQPVASAPSRRDVRSPEPRGAARLDSRDRDAGALLSSETDVAVARAFNTLSRTVLSDNARTLEDLVTEMLRPLLKAWLDDNLPSLVERLVRIEIERVARGRPAD
jgi:cell pole-organizing protein PopZ